MVDGRVGALGVHGSLGSGAWDHSVCVAALEHAGFTRVGRGKVREHDVFFFKMYVFICSQSLMRLCGGARWCRGRASSHEFFRCHTSFFWLRARVLKGACWELPKNRFAEDDEEKQGGEIGSAEGSSPRRLGALSPMVGRIPGSPTELAPRPAKSFR